jgi:hypothetical protein
MKTESSDNFNWRRERLNETLQVCDLVESFVGCAPGVELGRDKPCEHVLAWRWRPVQMTASGLQAEQPVKANEDTVDSTRFITATWGPTPAPLTIEERIERQLPPDLRQVAGRPADPLFVDGRGVGRMMAIAEERRKIEAEEVGEFASFWEGLA